MKNSTKLNRFTTLPIALDILKRKSITLLSPNTWEDRNDAYYLERYQEESGFGSVLAVCFSKNVETYHHWRIFSAGCSGVCVEFDANKLLTLVNNKEGFRHSDVEYSLIKELQECPPDKEKWPFVKRAVFSAEDEHRIIYETDDPSCRTKHLPITLAAINKITLSPWIPESVAESVISIITSIDDCQRIPINRSTLIENAEWRAILPPKSSQAAVAVDGT